MFITNSKLNSKDGFHKDKQKKIKARYLGDKQSRYPKSKLQDYRVVLVSVCQIITDYSSTRSWYLPINFLF